MEQRKRQVDSEKKKEEDIQRGKEGMDAEGPSQLKTDSHQVSIKKAGESPSLKSCLP